MKSKIILFLTILLTFTFCADTDPVYNKDRKQSPYPDTDAGCDTWGLIDNVCCAEYCDNEESSEGCGNCGGHGSAHCKTMDSFACRSGDWGFDFNDISNEFHYSRSTHFGLTFGGACGFGLYQVCGDAIKYTDEATAKYCDAFCKAYPSLCEDPAGQTYRGNYAAPQGNYYTQFWGALEGDQDNYLSCGECFEVYKTKEDGSDYKPGEEGYQPPVLLSIIDSCPCTANVKWCCSSEWDQCQSINYKYGCPIPKDSIHLDLSDVAMARLQTGDPLGNMETGVIPNKYRRVPCPKLGNMYVWLRNYSSQYWFSLTVVNSAGFGGIAVLEAKNDAGKWVKLIRDPNYTSSRPQERYGLWVTPKDSGPYNLPIDLRLTDGSGVTVVAEKAIKSFTPPADVVEDYYYIDIGVNFPEIPIPDPK